MEYDNNCNINKKLMNPIAEKIKKKLMIQISRKNKNKKKQD